MVARSVSKKIDWLMVIASAVTTAAAGASSGQPSVSSNWLITSACIGQRSAVSGMPSLSLSGSGQPSSSRY